MSALEAVSLAANVAVVATLLLVVQQTRAASDQTAEASVQIALDGLQDLQMVFVERPHLWPYFRQGVADVPDELRAEVEAVAELHLTTVENLMSLPPAFIRRHWTQWNANVVRDFVRAPVLIEVASREPDLYSPKVLELVGAARGQLAEGTRPAVAPPRAGRLRPSRRG